eukprot:15465593-Alexandrium_andersonii.AAC.1
MGSDRIVSESGVRPVPPAIASKPRPRCGQGSGDRAPEVWSQRLVCVAAEGGSGLAGVLRAG